MKTRMNLLVFTPLFCLKRLRGMSNAKNDGKYNNTTKR